MAFYIPWMKGIFLERVLGPLLVMFSMSPNIATSFTRTCQNQPLFAKRWTRCLDRKRGEVGKHSGLHGHHIQITKTAGTGNHTENSCS